MRSRLEQTIETGRPASPSTTIADDALPRPQPPTVPAWSGAIDLVLWRHAEAEPSAEEGDLERRLTRKGQRQAQRMGGWLDRHLPEGTRVLASPARRVLETAHCLGRNVKARAELGPLATEEDVLALLRWRSTEGPRYKGTVLVVGHRASLAPLVTQLIGMPVAHLTFRKGAVWWLRSRTMEDGAQRNSVVAALSPDLLAGG